MQVSAERLEQQRLIVEAAAAFGRRELTPDHLRTPEFSRDRWNGLAGLGLTAMLIPEDMGGLGLSIGDVTSAIEELGQFLLREPLVASGVLPALLLSAAAPSSLRDRLIEGLADGSVVAAVAWQEGHRALDSLSGNTSLSAEGAGFVLSGAKSYVTPGNGYDGLLVLAQGANGVTLVWVEADAEGLASETLETADGAAVASVRFDQVQLDAEAVLIADAEDAFRRALDASAICASAELLGLSRAALSNTMDYLRTRQQFNRTIGSFQGLQHRAADLYIQQELSVAALKRAVADFEAAETQEQRSIAASRAKARCSSAAMQIVKEAVQMHGGIGYTDEHSIGIYLKRALTLSAWLGNSAEHRARFAALTLGGQA